ncbi:MAG: GTPase ObgE [Trueperaceae bacterium]
MAFRDVLDITVQGGKGGDGGLSFMRLKYIPKGGPDGGHGGRGGSVYLRAVDDITSLARLVGKSHFRAPVGQQGEGRNKAGAYGADIYVDVPVGTLAHDLTTGELVADLIEVGETAVVAKGGDGGRGNATFATSTRRAPRFAEFGMPGQTRKLRLELRTIADVGLVGYPNAGKSSLLAALSNSRPEIASYPFTTLSPNLGVVERDRGLQRFTMADIPGIIEDAHLGKGLGLDFLRHISRTRLLVFVLDAVEEPVRTYESLRHELQEYDPELLERPALIVLNKADLLEGVEEFLTEAEGELALSGLPVMTISVLEGTGLEELRDALFDLLPPRPEPVKESSDRTVSVEPVQVKRDMSGQGWVVTGSDIEAVVSRFDPSNAEAVAYLQHHFKTMGVYKLLRKAGAQTGDDVQIGGAVFDFFDDTAPTVEVEEQDDAERAGVRYLESEAGSDEEPADEPAEEPDEDAAAPAEDDDDYL